MVQAIVFLRKVQGKANSAADSPLIDDSFINSILQYDDTRLPEEDYTELVQLANEAPKEKLFGLKFYAKLMDLQKEEKFVPNRGP